MPLDDTNWAGVDVQEIPDGAAPYSGNSLVREYQPSRHPRFTRFERAVLTMIGVLLLGVLAFTSEDIFPDAGFITRIAYGNAVANRNSWPWQSSQIARN